MAKSKTQRIADYLERHPDATADEVAKAVKTTVKYVYAIKSSLKKRGKSVGSQGTQMPEDEVMTFVPVPPINESSLSDMMLRLSQEDMVNHPPHYTFGGVETIDFIEAKQLSYNLGNVVKYISRAGHKDYDTEVRDLRKALWYLEREIALLGTGE